MDNYKDIFSFGDADTNENQHNNFNYNEINGLGESNYENEDLFNTEVSPYQNEPIVEENQKNSINNYTSDSSNYSYSYDSFPKYSENYIKNALPNENALKDTNAYTGNAYTQSDFINDNIYDNEDTQIINLDQQMNNNIQNTTFEDTKEEIQEYAKEDVTTPVDVNESEKDMHNSTLEDSNKEEFVQVSDDSVENEEDSKKDIKISDTSLEELNKLTEYEEEKFDSTNINELFDKVSVNVQDASQIFKKNTDLKSKIDKRFDELKKLQSELESTRKNQIDEINNYKEEVLAKLTDKKEEIEKRLNILKEAQANLEKEKKEFESYKKKEKENIDNVQKQVQSAYDERREELNHIESALRKQKDALDEERNQMSLDRIQYEADKNELANNLLKFNELVNSFTNGVNEAGE